MVHPLFIFIILVPLSIFYLAAVLLSSLKTPQNIIAGSVFIGITLYLINNASYFLVPLITFTVLVLFFIPKLKRNKTERIIGTSLILTLVGIFLVSYTLEQRRENKLINTEFYDIQVTQNETNPKIGYLTYKTKNAPRGAGIMLSFQCNGPCYLNTEQPKFMLYNPNTIVPLKNDTPLVFSWPEIDPTESFDLTLSIRGIDRGAWHDISKPSYGFLNWIPHTHHNEPHSFQSIKSYASKTIQVRASTSSD